MENGRYVVRSRGANRKQRLARGCEVAAKQRALAKLFRLYGFKEKLSRAEVRSEAYFAFKAGAITREQAIALGCSEAIGEKFRGVK